jgi:ATP-dependent Clp protease ATP-binding subunit ClpB
MTTQRGTKDETRLAGFPAFVRELDATLSVHPQYVLWGNLHDSFLVPEEGRLFPLRDLLWETLRRSGYSFMVVYDQVDGLRVLPADDRAAADAAASLFGSRVDERKVPSLEGLRTYLSSLARPGRPVRAAFVIDYASRIARNPTELEPAEKDFFVFCEKLSRTATPVRGEGERPKPLYNPIIWLAGRPGDLPPWLTADNDGIREIAVPRPHLGDRQQTARLLARAFETTDPDLDVTDDFAQEAEGLTLQAMIEVTRLAKEREVPLAELPDAVRTYKLGVLDNPWKREHLRKRIVDGEQRVPARVVGQPQAVTKTLDILKRAVLGLSGAQAARASSRPRGVLFFAGPTGVGKTELAKAITSLVFGNEDAYLRFDMSEFSAEHAGDRLIGSPPGYVGFEAGGELTNAIRQDPFRVILFDEIEKAHPRILDKFLQILEDGRLTDGRGNTAFFSESILVFTSNLGTRHVTPGMPYADLESEIRGAVTEHFTTELNRPELLNRFGDNIVIFDFIGPEAAGRIFDLQLTNICRRVSDEHHMKLLLSDEVTATLRDWCTSELDKGGRGIGMALESYFINPLARALFDRGPATEVTVTGIRREGHMAVVDLR